MSAGTPQNSLAGKVAIVTGAGGAIGLAHVMRLVREGVRVVANDNGAELSGQGTDQSRAAAVAAQVKAAGGEAVPSTDSVVTMEGGRRIVETALDHFGRLDILINNAGNLRPNRIYEMSEEDFDTVIAIHLKGTFTTTRHAAPHMCKQRSGVIINTGSNAGQGQYGNSVYAAAKEGIVGFTRSIARDLGPFNVRCNAIRPGAASRHGKNTKNGELIVEAEEKYGFPLCGDIWVKEFRAQPGHYDPRHIADFVAWLCTDAASHINGMDFQVMGGEIGLMTQPLPERLVYRRDGWDLANLNDPTVSRYLVGHLKNRFLPKQTT
jgi:NAD(P)-dependent dehydrogenase (short-subunit alcohol dehydrogenase family)